tara:strand:- start:7138 stop:7950 length:813 start_codon:yes stop_codon:yes gene_type:complete
MIKKVILRRKETKSFLPKEIQLESRMYLSSVYKDRQPLRAFSATECKKYLDGLLDVDPEHVEWPRHEKKYWAELTINVPFAGVELDISTDEDGNPINIEEWVRYKWALRHPHVANSESEMKKQYGKRFYILDPQKEIRTKNNKIQVLKDADKEFIKASGSVDKMRHIVRLLSNSTNPETLTKEELENLLYELKNSEPAKFLKFATDKHLELKAEIEEMVSVEILRKIGNQIIYIDEILGETMKDAVIQLTDKKNSGKLMELRAKLKEAKS